MWYTVPAFSGGPRGKQVKILCDLVTVTEERLRYVTARMRVGRPQHVLKPEPGDLPRIGMGEQSPGSRGIDRTVSGAPDSDASVCNAFFSPEKSMRNCNIFGFYRYTYAAVVIAIIHYLFFAVIIA